MKKLVFFGVVALIFTLGGKHTNAQIIDGAYSRNDVTQKKPVVLPSVREADVFWSKKVWRIVDLREKMNLPLYYPTTESDLDGHQSLISLLLYGVENELITPYDARSDNDDFKIPIAYEQIQQIFDAEATVVERRNFDTGETETVTIEGDISQSLNEVKQYLIKEEWYFDKQTSTMNVRIIGICPIREYVRENDPSGEIQREKVFWVYYPEARDLLATHLVLNPNNNASQMSFDDLFIKRYFSSYITKESNVYNNRYISDYLEGREALLESQRIEDEMFNFEQDLWEY